MTHDLDPLAPRNLVAGWLAGAAAVPLALVSAVVGQALGAALGGCAWIGVSLPPDRQVWALVNEPTLHFASLGAATGYWLGSLLLPLVLAFAVIPAFPRSRTVAGELAVIHIAWGQVVVGLAWLPVIDPIDGHLLKWLKMRGLPPELVWGVPLLAAAAAVPVAIHLLALTRAARPLAGTAVRFATVILHLFPAVAGWLLVAFALAGRAPAAAAAVALPAVVVLAVALRGLPSPFVGRGGPVSARALSACFTAAVILVSVIWLAGRPSPPSQRVGVLWGRPLAFNNIRPWIDPRPLGDNFRGRSIPAQPSPSGAPDAPTDGGSGPPVDR